MTLLIFLLFVCFRAGVSEDWINKPQYSSGGVRAVFREAPWHAGLYTTTTRPYKQICGATVVTKYAVLTAAHCFTKTRQVPPASNFAVAAGKIYRPWNNQQDIGAQGAEVANIFIPPRYQGSEANFQDDIAIATVFNWFVFNDFIQPACVSFNPEFDELQLREGEIGKFVGWGQTGPNTPASQVLQSITVPTIAIEKCIEQSPASFRSAITGDKICAGYNNGTAVCHGDSGGGLVFPGQANGVFRMFLRGVASTSPPDENSCNIYTWATFTHLLRHEHFIKAAVPDIEDACDDPSSLGFRYGGSDQGRSAHCFTKTRQVPPASNFAVAAGKIYRPWNNQQDIEAHRTKVAEIFIPPRYQGSEANFQDDIAIATVFNWFAFNDFIQPACVSFNPEFDELQLREGAIGKFVGWGQTGPNTPASQVLQSITVPTVAIEKCIEQSPASFRNAITGDKICAGYNNGTAVCHGDSGGGLVFPGEANGVTPMFLRGVASTSPPDENSCNIYTWATFTHLLRHEHFIKAAVPDIEDACDDPSSLRFRYGGGDPGRCRCSCVCK